MPSRGPKIMDYKVTMDILGLQSQDESKQQHHEYEEMKRQIEEDGDREILMMKNKFEEKLHNEQETNQKLHSENGILVKKLASTVKEIKDHKDEILKCQGENAKLNNVIRNLEKDISGLKKEIQERDETIQDKVGLFINNC